MTTNDSTQPIETMTEGECWARLGNHVIGRLVVSVGHQPDIFPVNYRIDDDEIVVRTAEGTKLAAAIMGGLVAFEIDDFDELGHTGWSVVVHGTARESVVLEDVMHDDEIGIDPWAAGEKGRVMRIAPDRITGRRVSVQRPTDQAKITP